jgi:hypothetical protein
LAPRIVRQKAQFFRYRQQVPQIARMSQKCHAQITAEGRWSSAKGLFLVKDA